MELRRRDLLASGTGLLGSMLLASIPAATAADPGRLDQHLATLGTLADASVASGNTPGVAVIVWRDGREIHSHFAGHANLETRTPVSSGSIFRVGSLTKQFTAALVLKLVSTGKLSLDDTACSHLPFLSGHEDFSIMELLQHTAGIRDGDYPTSGSMSQIEQAERISRMQPLFDFAPGTAWRYSNAGYMLVGAIIEKATGLPLAEAAFRLLFEPLGLGGTAFDSVGDVVAGRVSGYTPTGQPAAPYRNADYLDVALAGAAGAMRSTASDLCRWHDLLFRGRYLPLPMVASMLAPARLRNGDLAGTRRHDPAAQGMGDTQYGLGLMLDSNTIDGKPIAGHHGGINGFAAYLASHPSSRLTYACLCNADTHPGLPLRDVRRQVLAPVLA